MLEEHEKSLITAIESAVTFLTDDRSCLGCSDWPEYDHDADCIVRELEAALANTKARGTDATL